jgi:hypothetical protein
VTYFLSRTAGLSCPAFTSRDSRSASSSINHGVTTLSWLTVISAWRCCHGGLTLKNVCIGSVRRNVKLTDRHVAASSNCPCRKPGGAGREQAMPPSKYLQPGSVHSPLEKRPIYRLRATTSVDV